MSLNIKVVNSCKFLTIKADQYDQTSVQAEIKITEVSSGQSYTAIMNYDAQGKGNINVPTGLLPSANGVFRACLSEMGLEYACVPILIKCDIDCCLTKLTDELIDCACDCPRCAKFLAKAQKIFLLLQSAIEAIEIAGTDVSGAYYQEIAAKYKKAREICDNSCGCEC